MPPLSGPQRTVMAMTTVSFSSAESDEKRNAAAPCSAARMTALDASGLGTTFMSTLPPADGSYDSAMMTSARS